ncbi:hypothetical protein Rs2_28216 [Raphanus sativus]|nr:hypothetical protein Rs2_28216 [Raphanus sativus]
MTLNSPPTNVSCPQYVSRDRFIATARRNCADTGTRLTGHTKGMHTRRIPLYHHRFFQWKASIHLDRDLILKPFEATTLRSIFSPSESVIKRIEISSDHQANKKSEIKPEALEPPPPSHGTSRTDYTDSRRAKTTKRLHRQRPRMPTTQS